MVSREYSHVNCSLFRGNVICHIDGGSELNTVFTSFFLSVVSTHLKISRWGFIPEDNDDHEYFLLIAIQRRSGNNSVHSLMKSAQLHAFSLVTMAFFYCNIPSNLTRLLCLTIYRKLATFLA